MPERIGQALRGVYAQALDPNVCQDVEGAEHRKQREHAKRREARIRAIGRRAVAVMPTRGDVDKSRDGRGNGERDKPHHDAGTCA